MWESPKTQCEINKRTIVWIFLFGFLLRLYTAFNICVVNPDGTIYIHQAKALFYAQWDQLTSCGINYLSIYLFFAVYLLRLSDFVGHLKNNKGAVYLAAVSSASLVVLYVHLLHSWQIYTRFIAIVLFSSVIVIGFGLERVMNFAHQRLNLKASVTPAILGCLIVALALPRSLGPREKDKLVFRELGEIIAMREGNGKPVKVLASRHAVASVSFYANLNFRGAVCPSSQELKDLVGQSYAEFIRNLKKTNVTYYVWEEKNLPRNSFDFLRSVDHKDLTQISGGHHPSTGKMVLLKVL